MAHWVTLMPYHHLFQCHKGQCLVLESSIQHDKGTIVRTWSSQEVHMRHLVSFNNLHDEAYISLVREVHYLSAINDLSEKLRDNVVFSMKEKERIC